MNLSTNWEFHKQDKEKILWVHICSKDLTELLYPLIDGGRKDIPVIKLE